MSCKIQTNFEALSCDDKVLATGGVKQKIWLGNISDLDATLGTQGFTIDGNGYVTAINFNGAYPLLYSFTGIYKGGETTSSAEKNEDGNVSYPQGATIRVQDETPAQRTALEQLANAEAVFAIVETMGGNFELFGWDGGMAITSAQKTRGRKPEDSAVRTVVLAGSQSKGLEKIILDTDYSTTLAKIISYEAA